MEREFFLGANSAEGFYSLYEDFCREKGGYLYLIKGGAGGGKSSFMKRLAEKAVSLGYDLELIRCSGDPESLDGVYITQLGLGWLDATSPHILEPQFFGVNSCYVNISAFCSRTSDESISLFTEKYKSMYDIAYSYLKAANCVKSAEVPDLIGDFAISKAKQRAKSAVLRELGKAAGEAGTVSRRFIRCISCQGELILYDTVKKLCKHIILLDDRFGLEQYYLDEVLKSAADKDAIICPSPLDASRLDALLFPQSGVAFVCASIMPNTENCRHVRLDALVSASAIRSSRQEIRCRERLYSELINFAVYYLNKAKEYHDLLEAAYRPYVDFSALSEYTDREIIRVFK